MKKYLFTYLLVLSAFASGAQTDSAAVVDAKWKTLKIDKGITLKQYWFNNTLFGSNQNITILEIKQKKRHEITLGIESQKRIATSEFGSRENAIAAINGTFFDVKNGGSVDYIRSRGMVVNHNRLNKNNQRAIHQRAAISSIKGKLDIHQWDSTENWEEKLPGEEVMLSGPLLILSGRETSLDTSAFVKLRHPRSAIATKGKKVYFITIDGRHSNAVGMNLTELRQVLRWLKMDKAINLDGGGSTALWVFNQPDNGIVNYPSDNKQWDHNGERKVANAVLVKRRSSR